MAKLSTKTRNALPKSAFAGPGRSYPVNDPSHARNAKARASEMYNKGKISSSEKSQIDRKADTKLNKTKGLNERPEKHATHGLNVRPDGGERGKDGRGHDQPGLGNHKGSEKHGGHANVVNVESHGCKLDHD
jgi:hypothetical protein